MTSKRQSSAPTRPLTRRGGFTLIEILMAVVILAAVTGVGFLAFSLVTQAWRRGLVLSDDLHHGDFVLEQLVMGLRSAYYREQSSRDSTYGFMIEDNGDDPYSSDMISWVKLGGALVGKEALYAGSPHRVEFFVEQEEGDRYVAAVRAWRILGQPEDFDPEEDVESVHIARKVTGFNCRMKDPESEDLVGEEEIEWIDEWEDTNQLPRVVEITLWMEPLDEGEPPLELQRIIEIPLAALSWSDGSSSSSSQTTSSVPGRVLGPGGGSLSGPGSGRGRQQSGTSGGRNTQPGFAPGSQPGQGSDRRSGGGSRGFRPPGAGGAPPVPGGGGRGRGGR